MREIDIDINPEKNEKLYNIIIETYIKSFKYFIYEGKNIYNALDFFNKNILQNNLDTNNILKMTILYKGSFHFRKIIILFKDKKVYKNELYKLKINKCLEKNKEKKELRKILIQKTTEKIALLFAG
uniref:Uncharacterized protein n=1 Tax=Pithovirus LCPAC104 TaxID=2506589 RepID=A0A481Z3R3_9VIRU|nr:MAG: hypothetical protein LCPAC104_00290 [Pithovirus LCPAC104]